MNVVTFGSCMSEGVFAALRRDFLGTNPTLLNHVIHNRSDYFVDNFIEKKTRPIKAMEVIDWVDTTFSSESPGKNLIEEATFFLDNQSTENIGINRCLGRQSFIENIHNMEIDIFILDNFMDIASMLACELISNKKYFIYSGAFSSAKFDSIYAWSGHLSAIESINNWNIIIRWLNFLQPNSKIYFCPFPGRVHGHNERPSILRSRDFREAIPSLISVATTITTPDVSETLLLSSDDWCHYSQNYYSLVAEIISSSLLQNNGSISA